MVSARGVRASLVIDGRMSNLSPVPSGPADNLKKGVREDTKLVVPVNDGGTEVPQSRSFQFGRVSSPSPLGLCCKLLVSARRNGGDE